MKPDRQFPVLPTPQFKPSRNISFVTIRFSSELEHNLLRSSCVHDECNELIIVDNSANVHFDHLTQAIIHGVDKARHDLVAVVHEDVHLVDGWQQCLEQSLMQLEESDPDWGLVGAVGWDNQKQVKGHWSDPHQYGNTFAENASPFAEVVRLDEQILIFRRNSGVVFDPDLPSIHNIGRDLSEQLRSRGRKTYAINAPTTHKMLDGNGTPILSAGDSSKIVDRGSLTYQADLACSDDYIAKKWPRWARLAHGAPPSASTMAEPEMRPPLVLLARGGSGSRLLSQLALDCGVFLGEDLSPSLDTREVIMPFYRALMEKHTCSADWQAAQRFERVKHGALAVQAAAAPGADWGFKLPESLFLLLEIDAAFPSARYVFLSRSSWSTCARRTHMTARVDNHVGRLALKLAYDAAGRSRAHILTDSDPERMAYTTLHQRDLVHRFAATLPSSRFLQLSFEEVVTQPETVLCQMAEWLGRPPVGRNIMDMVNPDRARPAVAMFKDEEIDAMERILLRNSHPAPP
ncbi:sulfotransferase [Marinihelvus fidelis]|uniref:Sulfotransferase n=1 Tax=Marinihelvus fidelis TaxID=2613842 RepID=A0A5N0TAI5_9GAMM|nr:sulfotransferase [Marinihelvus fidelis]KAA9131972.1 sulfotransferase [Marinihelvus fidelis]